MSLTPDQWAVVAATSPVLTLALVFETRLSGLSKERIQMRPLLGFPVPFNASIVAIGGLTFFFSLACMNGTPGAVKSIVALGLVVYQFVLLAVATIASDLGPKTGPPPAS